MVSAAHCATVRAPAEMAGRRLEELDLAALRVQSPRHVGDVLPLVLARFVFAEPISREESACLSCHGS